MYVFWADQMRSTYPMVINTKSKIPEDAFVTNANSSNDSLRMHNSPPS